MVCHNRLAQKTVARMASAVGQGRMGIVFVIWGMLETAVRSVSDLSYLLMAMKDEEWLSACICSVWLATELCPKGDDPLTTGQASREILLGIDTLSGSLSGYLAFFFNGEKVMLDADASKLSDEK